MTVEFSVRVGRSTYVESPWFTGAACRGLDPELFFSDSQPVLGRAKEICKSCGIRESCLEWAIKREEFGVWGGTTALERRELRRQEGITLRRVLT